MKTFEYWIDFRDLIDDHSTMNRLSGYELYRLNIIEGSYTEFITRGKYVNIYLELTRWNYDNFKNKFDKR